MLSYQEKYQQWCTDAAFDENTKKELLNAKVSLVCYANTNCVKAYQVHTGKE